MGERLRYTRIGLLSNSGRHTGPHVGSRSGDPVHPLPRGTLTLLTINSRQRQHSLFWYWSR